MRTIKTLAVILMMSLPSAAIAQSGYTFYDLNYNDTYNSSKYLNNNNEVFGAYRAADGTTMLNVYTNGSIRNIGPTPLEYGYWSAEGSHTYQKPFNDNKDFIVSSSYSNSSYVYYYDKASDDWSPEKISFQRNGYTVGDNSPLIAGNITNSGTVSGYFNASYFGTFAYNHRSLTTYGGSNQYSASPLGGYNERGQVFVAQQRNVNDRSVSEFAVLGERGGYTIQYQYGPRNGYNIGYYPSGAGILNNSSDVVWADGFAQVNNQFIHLARGSSMTASAPAYYTEFNDNYFAAGTSNGKAFLLKIDPDWKNSSFIRQTVYDVAPAEYTFSTILDLNNNNQAIGYFSKPVQGHSVSGAFVYDFNSRSFTEVDSLLTTGSFLRHVDVVYDINESGSFVGNGLGVDGSPHSFLAVKNELLGSSPSLPLLPVDNGSAESQFIIAGIESWHGELPPGKGFVYIDPVVAVGYDYLVDIGPEVKSLLLPYVGDGKYNIWGFDAQDHAYLLEKDWDYHTTYIFSNAVKKFRVDGIEVDAALDPNNPMAFVTGLTFEGEGTVNMRMLALTYDTDAQPTATPEPGTMLLMGFGAAGVAFMKRRRSAKVSAKDIVH